MNNKRINTILTCLYIPLSIFEFFFLMGTDALLVETDPLIRAWITICSYLGFFTFAICAGSMLSAHILYQKNHIRLSYFVRCIPIILITLMLLIDCIITAL